MKVRPTGSVPVAVVLIARFSWLAINRHEDLLPIKHLDSGNLKWFVTKEWIGLPPKERIGVREEVERLND